ncbi:flagellar hook-length control protein FliK [Methylobacterium sp. E-045]|uniref:flagellar hook-length control protein FliK n=1 Tax=Methylobacterium sp. E-045 TaxID=2836575 RepID=UPI001FBB98B0|nr:flagellar hook-length control protein FliK [Methylobacterium sp. E-045]MCJ2131786.1 flagellar hook-length control protein FliK [Methylobacterium sp. E-045]
MATTSINGDQASRFAGAPRSAPLPATDAAGRERFRLPAGEPKPAPASRKAMEPKAAIREGEAAKTDAATSSASPIAEPSSPVSKALRPGKTIPPSKGDAGGVVAAEAALREQHPVSGQIGDLAETRPLRAGRDEDQATPPGEAGLGGLPWSPQQPALGAAMPVSDGAQAPQVSSGQEGDRGSSGSPVDTAPLSGPPVQGHASALSSSAEGGGSQVALSHRPTLQQTIQAPGTMPRSGATSPTAEQNAATASAQGIATSAVEADPVTAIEERSDDGAVPADGTGANPTAALAPPGLLTPVPPANAPAMAVQAGAAPSPNASAIVPPGTGPLQAAAGRSVSVSVSGADRPAASQRETVSAEAFDELASGSTVTSDDLASAPAAPFSPLPAAHTHAPAPEPAGALPQTQAAPVPLGAVPMTIGLRSLAGSNRFEISLDPKDLGRIDVNLDIDKDSGTVTAHLTVDRPETLALLQRDVGNLQQALSQAGFDAGDAAINLSLRSDTGSNGGSGAERDAGGGREGRPGAPGSDLKDPRLSNDAVPLQMLRGLGGIDIRI